jgi:CheY-like chemotaxis protein
MEVIDSKQEVLLVEDNPDDVFLMQRAVKKAALPWNLTVIGDGQQALEYLAHARNGSGRTHLPSLVFLDLKLPYVTGFEVLASMRADDALRGIPVIILTSSPEQRDQQKALELGANGYQIKPPNEEMLRELAHADW